MLRLPFMACLGLDNRSAPESLAYDRQTGAWAAAALADCDVADGGRRILPRPGRALCLPGDWHSPFQAGDVVYAVWGESIHRLTAAGSGLAHEPLVSGLTVGAPVAWCRLGRRVFWSDGSRKGLFLDGVPGTWGGQPFSSDPDEAALYLEPPAGRVLAGFAGRVWIGLGARVHFTVPGRWNHVKAGFGYLAQPATVRLILPVDDGFYVGTDDGVSFLAGFDPAQLRLTVVSDDPPLPGAAVAVRSQDVAPRATPGGAAVWLTRGGCVMAGLSGGICLDLTNKRVAVTSAAARGAALVTNRRVVFTLLDA